MTVQRAGRQTDANVLQPGKPKRSSLFDAARRARALICRGAPRPDTTRKPRRAERGNGAARQRGGSAATRRPARFCGRDEHGEHPPVAPFEHRGTCPVSSCIDGIRTMRLRRVLDQLLIITVRRPCWSPAWCGARSDRALRSVPTCAGKLRSAAPLCPAWCSRLSRWPSWVCACVPGTILSGVLVARDCYRYRLGCLDHSLSHHASQRLLPEPPGLRPPPTSRAGASRFGGRSRPHTPLRLVGLAARHHRPGDARHLVRQRHRRQPNRTPLQHATQPGAGRAVPLRRPVHH
jgi:hypothetical protein